MKKSIAIIILTGSIIVSGCSYYKSCPTYTQDKKIDQKSTVVTDRNV